MILPQTRRTERPTDHATGQSPQPLAPPTDSYRLERRQAVRHVTTTSVTALHQSAGVLARDHHICALQLTDISDTGVGAVADEPIEPGSRIAIFFPPHGAEGGFDMHGRVVRCVTRQTGHEIGIHFDAKQAA